MDESNFEGTFFEGKKQGFGTQKWSDGSSYSGNWSMNMMSGQGKLIIKKRDKILYDYDGNFVENKKEGYGEISYNDGKTYKG